jgi:hypothetical protein
MRRSLRELVTWSVLAALLAVAGAFAWATHHPDSPWVARAEGWPVVGSWVALLRTRYLGPPAAAPQPPAAVPDTATGDPAPRRAGPPQEAPADPGEALLTAGRRRVWVGPGEVVRSAPDPAASPRGRSERYLWLPVLEERDGWVRVVGEAGAGWVRPLPLATRGPPLGSAPEPPGPLSPLAPDPERLALALDLLGLTGPSGHLGPLVLYTDGDTTALWYLDRLASQVEPAYRVRYGRDPRGVPREAALVFAREEDYRRFQQREERLAGLPAAGHSGVGLVALYLENQLRGEVAATLVHEMVHLVNRRALGPALPPWLDEGLADDLSGSEIGPAGDLAPERLGGVVTFQGGHVEYRGAVASLRQLEQARAAGELLSLARLTALDWDAFVRSERRTLHYAQAGLFVRYLLAEPLLAERFRRFLSGVAAGGPVDGEALRLELGWSWQDLEAGLAEWAAARITETRATPPGA